MRLFKNNEVRLLLGLTILMFFVFTVILMYSVKTLSAVVNEIQIKQNIAVIGSVVKRYPELESEIVKNYTREFQGNYEYGKSILDKYSYDNTLNIENNSSVQKELSKIYIKIKITIAAFCMVLILLFLLFLNRIYGKIRRISINAEAVVEGNYKPMDGDKEEGDIGFLTNQFNLMTERLSENLQTLNNEKIFLKKLITDISHQLKTPLASLVMFNDIMKNDTTLSDQDRATFVAESKNQLDRMEWLIKSMLKMAKLESGVVEFEMQEAYLADTVKSSIMGLKNIAEEKNIVINFLGDNSIRVKHDISWTTEAISNIIKNCIEHSGAGSEINISLDENKVFTQIVIQDKGPGIPKPELPKIFDRFYKGSRSGSPTNIGIGLYITKTIIEGQGGSIYVYSEEGKGTKFTVRLMKVCV